MSLASRWRLHYVLGMGKSRYNVVVVYKQPPAQSTRIPARAAQQHVSTLEELYRLLQQRGLSFRAIPIEQLGRFSGADLVITVGGDGTTLATSHFIQREPILGIKSIGEPSVGFFCAANRKTMARYLDDILAGKRTPINLARLSVSMGKHRLPELVLNECLFSHGSPAAITAYKLCLGKICEAQRSSGIWVAAAAGSTAAIRAAGGKEQPLTSTDMQYLVREPYRLGTDFQLLRGLIPAPTVIKIRSESSHGTLSIDGAHIQYPVPEGTTITIRVSKQPLRIYWK